jgi:hypothetical protein
MRKVLVTLATVALGMLVTAVAASAAEPAEGTTFDAGFAKVDVTPQTPVRMSGYGNRDHPSEGIETKLHARAMALRPAASAETFVLVQFDIVGMPASFTEDVARQVQEMFKVARDHFVLCATHTHAGPHLPIGLTNIFQTPMTDEERKRGDEYVDFAKQRLVEVVGVAIQDLKPAALSLGTGRVGFAANRRVVKDGRWTGFGVQPNGPTDHRVDVLKIVSPADGKLRGVVFNYACHATTVGGDYYRINGDWPALAAEQIESDNAGATALSVIGCGADANPEPRGSAEQAKAHGKAMGDEVERVIAADKLAAVTAAPTAAFGHAELSFDVPTVEQLKARLNDPLVQAARQAKEMLATIHNGGKLPSTYPVPVQSWRFGDELTMVFLGGEVVVDYAIRLKREIDSKHVWITAYANDVMGYVASERVRREGGYEVDTSMVLYDRPGPWASGTEEKLVTRVHEIVAQAGGTAAKK